MNMAVRSKKIGFIFICFTTTDKRCRKKCTGWAICIRCIGTLISRALNWGVPCASDIMCTVVLYQLYGHNSDTMRSTVNADCSSPALRCDRVCSVLVRTIRQNNFLPSTRFLEDGRGFNTGNGVGRARGTLGAPTMAKKKEAC